jgi:RNA 3'-terminal phosphate cyclase
MHPAGGRSTLELRGGTDVSFSPPIDFTKRLLVPALESMGAGVGVELVRRGFYPKGGWVYVSRLSKI